MLQVHGQSNGCVDYITIYHAMCTYRYTWYGCSTYSESMSEMANNSASCLILLIVLLLLVYCINITVIKEYADNYYQRKQIIAQVALLIQETLTDLQGGTLQLWKTCPQ